MKKIFLILIFLLSVYKTSYGATISIAPFNTADDVTVTHLENQRTTIQDAINSADGSLIQNTTITTAKLDANANPENRWNESFNDFVYTGLTIPTSANLTSTTALGTAYIVGTRVVKDAVNKTYTASKWTFVDLSNNGTYTYSETEINATEPSVASNSIRLARVSTDSTTVLAVRDDRVTNIIFSRYRAVVASRLMDAGFGDVSYTGAGFSPRGVMIYAEVDGGSTVSWGFASSSTAEYAIMNVDGGTTLAAIQSTDTVINAQQSAGNNQTGAFKSFDSDGITITWTKNGTPSSETLTITIFYML